MSKERPAYQSISRPVRAEVETDKATGRTSPLSVELRFANANPFAVTMAIRQGDGWVEWVFARELLTAGLSQPRGIGDITVTPNRADPSEIIIHLSVPEGRGRNPGEAVIFLQREEVATWLEDTYRLVPLLETACDGLGPSSYIDWDTEIAGLLGTDSGAWD